MRISGEPHWDKKIYFPSLLRKPCFAKLLSILPHPDDSLTPYPGHCKHREAILNEWSRDCFVAALLAMTTRTEWNPVLGTKDKLC